MDLEVLKKLNVWIYNNHIASMPYMLSNSVGSSAWSKMTLFSKQHCCLWTTNKFIWSNVLHSWNSSVITSKNFYTLTFRLPPKEGQLPTQSRV